MLKSVCHHLSNRATPNFPLTSLRVRSYIALQYKTHGQPEEVLSLDEFPDEAPAPTSVTVDWLAVLALLTPF